MSNPTPEDTQVEPYRFITGSLFEYNADSNSYLCCFTCYRANTEEKAIAAYERCKNRYD